MRVLLRKIIKALFTLAITAKAKNLHADFANVPRRELGLRHRGRL